MHGDRFTLAPDDAGLQHDWDMLDKANALVRLRGTENCTIKQCHFAHSGSGAIRVDLHGRKNKLSGNHIENMGGAGILLCGYYLSLRESPLTDAVIKRNIFYSTGKDTVFIDELAPGNSRKSEDRRGRSLARARDADTDYNIYYSATDPVLGETMLKKQQVDGVDSHSLAVDPSFVDPSNGDFRLKPDSPALNLGIVPLDMSKVGLQSDKK